MEILENNQNHNVEILHFQQDGASTHNVAPVCGILDDRLSGRQIERKVE